MIPIGMDPGTRAFGVARLADRGRRFRTGTIRPPAALTKDTKRDIVARCRWIVDQASVWLEGTGDALVGIESASMGSTNKAFTLGGIHMLARDKIERSGSYWVDLAPTQVKLGATGVGTGSKEAAHDRFLALLPATVAAEFDSEDEIDAAMALIPVAHRLGLRHPLEDRLPDNALAVAGRLRYPKELNL